MKFCYVDESGMGSEPYLVMAGVIVDAHRMRKTKEIWDEFLRMLSKICKRSITEFHARDFYAGNRPWRGIRGPERARIISAILEWWGKRKHSLTFTAIDKKIYTQMVNNNEIPEGCDSIWKCAAIHIALSIQKAHQNLEKNKGHTLLLFDREAKEEIRISEFISKPPRWTDEYYNRGTKQSPLDQIVDVPFFADSRHVLLIQVADLIAFVLRRFAELTEKVDNPRYNGEVDQLNSWIELISRRCYPLTTRWPTRGLNKVQAIFDKLAPLSLKKIGKH